VRRLLVILFTLLASADAGAQIIRSRYQLGEPAGWVSLGAALQQGYSVTDGATGSRWEFGNVTQYVAALEKAISGGTSVGIRGTRAKVPLRYVSATSTSDADAEVSQLFGTIHVAGGGGFHSVLELGAGATLYDNFRTRANSSRVGPTSVDADFSFAIGYGFGYAFSREFSVDVVQDVTTTLHQKTGLSAGDDSTARMYSTRLVARFGLGGK
jgi:hypothetical protein